MSERVEANTLAKVEVKIGDGEKRKKKSQLKNFEYEPLLNTFKIEEIFFFKYKLKTSDYYLTKYIFYNVINSFGLPSQKTENSSTVHSEQVCINFCK